MAPVTFHSFSARGIEILRTMANMLPHDIRPTPMQLFNLTKYLKTDLKICLTLRGEALIRRNPDEIPGILKALETDACHIRDLLVGLGEGLNGIVPEGADEVEIPLRDLVHLTREHRGSLSRKEFIKREAQNLYYFSSIRQRIRGLAEKGTIFTWGTWMNLSEDLDHRGADIFRSMGDYASRNNSTIADMDAGLALLEPDLKPGTVNLPARLRGLL